MSSKTASALRRLDAEAQKYIQGYPVRVVRTARLDGETEQRKFETTQHPDPGCPSWEDVPVHHQEDERCLDWFTEQVDREHATSIQRGKVPAHGTREWIIRHGGPIIGQDTDLTIAMLEAAVNLAKREKEES